MTRFLRLTATRLLQDGRTELVDEWLNPDHIVRVETDLADQHDGPMLSLLLSLSTGALVYVPITGCPDPERAGDLADNAVRSLLEQPTTAPLTALTTP